MFGIFDQQESFKLDMIDLACGVIRISNNVLALRYSINKVIRILLPVVISTYQLAKAEGAVANCKRGETSHIKITLWEISKNCSTTVGQVRNPGGILRGIAS